MLDLESAIKHAEEVADLCEDSASRYDMNDPFESHMACQDGKCAEEHRQLAEWLRELKAYRERMPSYEAGYNDAKKEIALSGEYKRAYDRGYEQACKDKIDIPYKAGRDSVDCENTKCENCTNHNYCDYETESEDKA